MIARATPACARQNNLPGLGSRVSLDDYSIDFRGALKIVLSGDQQLFRINACLDVDNSAGADCIDGSLNG
jgi:hypothetical protein